MIVLQGARSIKILKYIVYLFPSQIHGHINYLKFSENNPYLKPNTSRRLNRLSLEPITTTEHLPSLSIVSHLRERENSTFHRRRSDYHLARYPSPAMNHTHPLPAISPTSPFCLHVYVWFAPHWRVYASFANNLSEQHSADPLCPGGAATIPRANC